MPDRIERNVIIARSGVYAYSNDELPSLCLPPSLEPKDIYHVYRPAIVLANNKDKFTKLPLTREHPSEMVGPGNFKELTIGWSGDTSQVVIMPDSQEIGIESTCQLLDESALEYYDNGVRDVSPGYFAQFQWASGETVDGEKYDIIMTDIEEVNHLAFTQRGRGGVGVAMDSISNLANLAYYSNRLTTDSGQPSFRKMIDDIVEYRGDYEDDEIKIGVMELLKLCDNMPDCDEKAILQRIIKDFYNVKNAFSGNDAAKVAADLVAGRYESLDSKIMEDSMALFKGKGKATDADPIPPNEEKEAPPAAPDPAATEAPPEAPGMAPAPVAAAAMEVAQMPDDVSAVSDDELRAIFNGLIKFAKSIAPGEVQEPQHQEAAAPVATDSGKEVEEEIAKDGWGEKAEEVVTKDDGIDFVGKAPGIKDSIFKMSMVSDSGKSSGLAAFTAGLYKQKGAK
jgi:hypothetical protein